MTTGDRSANMSLFAESEGAFAVVVNAPTDVQTIQTINKMIDVPIIYTVVSDKADIASRIEAGVDILNVSGGAQTAAIVAEIRKSYPNFPIMATGGPSQESVEATIAAGANAITYTPPSNAELFKLKMEKYRLIEEDGH